MPNGDDGLDESLGPALLALSRAMVALAARNLSELGAEVTLPQYRALVLLASRGPLRSAALAHELNVAPSTLTRMSDRLERKGLIRRFHRERDRRSIWLGLSEHGRDVIGRVMRGRQHEIEELIRVAGLRASGRTVEVLQRFVEATGELRDDEWWRRWERSADPGS